jgi:hypothetical protein
MYYTNYYKIEPNPTSKLSADLFIICSTIRYRRLLNLSLLNRNMAAATIAALQKAFPFPKSPSAALLLGAVIAGFLYLVGLAVYRLYFSPIARFPGPKLAALSRWYEFYYDCVLPGQFTFHIQELHKKYGE